MKVIQRGRQWWHSGTRHAISPFPTIFLRRGPLHGRAVIHGEMVGRTASQEGRQRETATRVNGDKSPLVVSGG